ncbi:MAG: hypothetical protein COA53_09035 [Rhodobacteraceae bacterium]|nr:MAG: hypothetical protein COA53_09035 [Paracoccaceae bacterium]
MKSTALAALFAALPLIAAADIPTVTAVDAIANGGTWRFDVSILHADTGWEHYADGWGVYTIDGIELGYRTLVHPHVNEQPFTRSLSGVTIPAGTTEISIIPHDLVHGDGPKFTVTLPTP